MRMQLQRRRRDERRHRPLDRLRHRLSLALARGQQDRVAGFQNGAYALGDDVVRHLADVVVEEARVVDPGLLGQRLDPGAGRERGARLVEADVTVGADTQQLQVHPAGCGERLVVRLACGLHVLGGAVGAHEGRLGQAERFDDLAQHHRAVRLGVAGRQSDVLVELADAGARGIHLAGADLCGQCLVDGQRGRTGGNAEKCVGLAAEQGADGSRDEFAACLGVRDDDNFHAGPADLRR